ncbi:MAG TPA: 2-phospho-L-lactate guanylyltransferase [Mycobacteriales bacterium]|nr:2-phospho-L-lactate guanylyltransferase [Mycobacteriales bacterium]
MTAHRICWSVVVPVKRLPAAKTRLRPPGTVRREDLALAMALDTVQAALACPAVSTVVAVCDDPVASPRLAALGAEVVADEPDAGLNPALAHGVGVATAARPDCGVALLSSDLPALQAADLAEALDQAAAYDVSVVADHAGTGTVLLTALPGVPLAPAFGAESLAAHTAAGAVALESPLERLRRDVDTAEDLEATRRLGFGPHTSALLSGS